MNKGIKYKQVIDLGFKRKDLGGDSVFYDQYGYDWFIASKTLVKEQGCKIVANWHPETQEIEVLYLDKKRNVVSRQRFSGQHGLARYRAIQLFFKPQQIQYRSFTLKDTGDFSKEKEIFDKNAPTTEQPKYRVPNVRFTHDIGLLDFEGESIFVSGRFPRVGEIDAHMDVLETHASYIPVFDPATGLFQHKLPVKNKRQ